MTISRQLDRGLLSLWSASDNLKYAQRDTGPRVKYLFLSSGFTLITVLCEIVAESYSKAINQSLDQCYLPTIV